MRSQYILVKHMYSNTFPTLVQAQIRFKGFEGKPHLSIKHPSVCDLFN